MWKAPSNPNGSPDDAYPTDCVTGTCPCQPITSITILKIEYTSDHKLLQDYTTDWRNGGKVFPKPDWTPARQNPISHSMDKFVEITLTIEVKPPNACPETGTIQGVGPDKILFEKRGHTFTGGVTTIPLRSDRKLDKKIQELNFKIDWTTVGTSVAISPSNTANTIFVTMNTPQAPRQPGITLKRMRRAVSDTGSAGSLDPHEIVKHVMQTWGNFNVHVALGNEWDLADDAKDAHGSLIGADCETIVRFTEAVIKMVGCPGLSEAVVVWAKPSAPAVAIENAWGGAALNNPLVSHPTKPWMAALVDGGGNQNFYEACLKFTYDKKVVYYAGGVGPKKSKDEVLLVFTRMSWFGAKQGGGIVEKEVIHTY